MTMNIKIAACALMLALGLGGCATVDPTTGKPTPMPDIGSIIKQVQDATALACKFVPTAGTVAQIISAGNPVVVTVSGIANAVCEAVAPPLHAGAKRKATLPMVNGVVIKGRFL